MIRQVFYLSPAGREVENQLMSLQQGNERVMGFASEFCMLAVESSWNKPALKEVFCRGLNHDILTQLACRDDEATLGSLIDMVIRIDNLLVICVKHSQQTFSRSANSVNTLSKPMQLGHAHLSAD